MAERPLDAFVQGRGLWAALLSFLLLTVFTFSVAMVPIRADNDCWWHVKTGEYILAHGIPEHDPFSYATGNYPYHTHEWLTQIAMAKVWAAGERTALGGWRALILAVAGVLWAGYAVLWGLAAKMSRSFWIALLIAVVAVGVGRRTFYPRPPVISNLMLAIELVVLVGAHEGWLRRRWLAALPLLFALWSNLHGGWMAGLVVLGAFLGADVLGLLRAKTSWKWLPFEDTVEPIPAKLWAGLFPACILATFCNPFGYHLHGTFFVVMGDKLLTGYIGELLPPQWIFVYDFVAWAMLLVAGTAIARARGIRAAEAGVAVFFLWQAMKHVRHLLLFGVLMVPFAARLLARLFGNARVGPLLLVVSLGWMGVVLRNWPESQSYPARNAQYAAMREGYIVPAYPAALADFVELARLEGRMFNENNYAGYLIWRLSPEKAQVFSDSRFDIFGSHMLRDELSFYALGELEPLDKWNANWVITISGSRAEAALAAGGPWTLVADWQARPDVSARPFQIWVRDTPENAAMIERARNVFRGMYGSVVPSP